MENIFQGSSMISVTSVPMLLLGIFMIASYTIYPIAVIIPGWLTYKRVFKLYGTFFIFFIVYIVTLVLGVEYREADSLLDLLPMIGHFDVWFRVLICVVILMKSLLCYFGLRFYVKKHNNRYKHWLQGYMSIVFINTIAFLLMFVYNNQHANTTYYFLSITCSFFIIYKELFSRLVVAPESQNTNVQPEKETGSQPVTPIEAPESASSPLWNQIEAHMKQKEPWRNPDLTISMLANAVYSNRTSVSTKIHEAGYENFYDYIAHYRIREFCLQAEKGQISTIIDTFYMVGFKSRSAAFNQFKRQMNMTPSEYLKNLKLAQSNIRN